MSAPGATRAAGSSSAAPNERPGAREQADRPAAPGAPRPRANPAAVPEIGGPLGPEPTRYGDWEKGGRCTDF